MNIIVIIFHHKKLIAYLKANEHSSNEEVYKEYHNITNICKRCNSVMNYSGFKNGYRCSKKCSNKRKIKAKAEIKLKCEADE